MIHDSFSTLVSQGETAMIDDKKQQQNDFMLSFKDKILNDPERVAQLNGSYQLDLSEDGGSIWYLKVLDGLYDFGEGELKNAECTVKIGLQNLLAILEGRLNPMTAYVTGKIKMSGDVNIIQKFRKILG
jgi:putative sterol carrier protein